MIRRKQVWVSIALTLLCISAAFPQLAVAQGLVTGPSSSVVTDIVTWNNITGTKVADPGTWQITTGGVMQGPDSSIGGLLPSQTVRGGDCTAGSMPCAGADLTVRGGDSYSMNTTNHGGALLLRTGIGISKSGDQFPGQLKI